MSTSKRIKAVLVGNSGVGKTSLLNRAIQDQFSSVYKTTIGADFLAKSFPFTNSDGTQNELVLQLWDSAGRERFSSLGPIYYRGSDAVLICFDVSSLESFERVSSWFKEIDNILGITKGKMKKHAKVYIVGTKSDLQEKRVVSTTKAQELAEELGCEYYEVSAKENVNVHEMVGNIANYFMNPPELKEPPTPHVSENDEENESSTWNTFTYIYNWLASFVD
eukprot:TRINITY_DN1631_c0_g1_i5.p1 TRINITY_DN1631_c0_g1~~TRINITY_DN1631_c0_g1_i5.p1  ORF type:complete len:221 (-),score=68.90 TRINITY_DN1631_c0_g1_i5:8-670(-)